MLTKKAMRDLSDSCAGIPSQAYENRPNDNRENSCPYKQDSAAEQSGHVTCADDDPLSGRDHRGRYNKP